ncbi:MAG: hypothetical protein M1817_003860 [Caeruleum heppii]|nr:MAG: hypothetical protein M1817_003860 [Caeruleum heppii]
MPSKRQSQTLLAGTRASSSTSTASMVTTSGTANSDAISTTPPTSTTSTTSTVDTPNTSVPVSDHPSSVRKERRALRTRQGGTDSPKSGPPRAALGQAERANEKRTISGETLVDDTAGSLLLTESIKVLDLDWTVDAMPSSDARSDELAKEAKIPRRRSTRLDLVSKAKDGLVGTLSTLGKRGRDTFETGKDGVRDMAQGILRKASLRAPATQSGLAEAGPAPKKVRLAETPSQDEVVQSKPTRRRGPQDKLWLKQGLYVGQDRNFDGRFTEKKNKIKAASRTEAMPKERLILPLPMFLGDRLLKTGRDFKLPFNVFAPLPPGQSRPEEWRKTQKNVFVGDAASYWKMMKRQELSRCLCTSESGCGEDCQNRFMFYECDDSNCSIGSELCTNRSFDQLRQRCKKGGKYNVGVEVMKTIGKGYGVRSNRTFDPNQIIVEYAGEIITQEECEERMNTVYRDNECYYLMLFDQNMIIDATRGSIARFVNHSCAPNCKMVKWTVAGKPRMALFAGDKGIMSGEELTYDYNFDPFSIKNVQECRCGAADCRGVLGPRPKECKESKNVLSSLMGQAKSVKRKVQAAFGGESDEGPKEKASKKRRASVAAGSKSAAVTPTNKGADQKGSRMKECTIRVGQSGPSRNGSSRSWAGSGKGEQGRSMLGRMASRMGQDQGKGPTVPQRTSSKKAQTGPMAQGAGKTRTTGDSLRRTMVRSVRGSRRAAASLDPSRRFEEMNESGSTIRLVTMA